MYYCYFVFITHKIAFGEMFAGYKRTQNRKTRNNKL